MDNPELIPELVKALGQIDALLHEVASDLGGLGIAPAVEPMHPEIAAVQQAARLELEVVRQSLEELRSKAALVRRRHVARQLAALPAAEAGASLKLALTGTPHPGWTTIGFAPAELAMSLKWGLPFSDGAADYVYFALALEHFYYRGEALAILRDVRRVLRSGGVLRVVVPDLEKYFRAYAADNGRFFDEHAKLWEWARHARTRLDLTLMMAGAGMGRGPGDFFGHKTGYDLPTLRALLLEAGFSRVEERRYGESPHAELRVDRLSHDAGFGDGSQSYNLFVEAD